MALRKYPGYGDDATQVDNPYLDSSDDPMTALQTLLSGATADRQVPASDGASALATTPATGSLGARNSAIAGAIRKKFGLGSDTGDISQSDLEALDNFVRQGNVNETLSATMPQIQAKGMNDLATERARAADALNLENMKGQYGLKGEEMKGQTARDVAETAAQGRIDAAGAKGGAFVMGPNGFPINTKPLGQLEQRAITSFAEAKPVLDELESKLNPNENQFVSWLKNAGTGAAYNVGIATADPAQQAKYQLSGLLSIIGSSPYVVGSRSFQMIKLAMAHLTSPFSSDAFKFQQIQEIKKLWPQMQQEILAAHMNPADPSLTQAQPEDPNDPSTWARKQQ